MKNVDYRLAGRQAQAKQPPARSVTPAAEPPVYLTTHELAARLRRSTVTLIKWRSRRRGPRFIRPGGEGGPVLYRLSDVEAWERAATIETSGGN